MKLQCLIKSLWWCRLLLLSSRVKASLKCFICVSSFTTASCEISNIIISILHVRKLSLAEPDNLTLLTVLFYSFHILFVNFRFVLNTRDSAVNSTHKLSYLVWICIQGLPVILVNFPGSGGCKDMVLDPVDFKFWWAKQDKEGTFVDFSRKHSENLTSNGMSRGNQGIWTKEKDC